MRVASNIFRLIKKTPIIFALASLNIAFSTGAIAEIEELGIEDEGTVAVIYVNESSYPTGSSPIALMNTSNIASDEAVGARALYAYLLTMYKAGKDLNVNTQSCSTFWCTGKGNVITSIVEND